MTTTTLTPNTIKLFKELATDAPNWNGQPMFDGTKEERGNLTHLKKLGFITTFVSDGSIWVDFTEAGMQYATTEFGISF